MRTVGIHALLSSMGLLLCLPLVACTETHTYEGKAIQGQIVDAQSKQALEGAVVVALWAKRGGLHTDTIGYVHLDEAVTDAEGRYELKAWGPVEISGGYMGSFSPDLILFKQGYKYLRVNEGFLPPAKDRRVWTSKWDGKVIELERFEGNIYEYKKNLDFINSYIYSLRNGRECEWKKIPNLLVKLHKAGFYLKAEADKEQQDTKINTQDKYLVNMNDIYTVDRVWNQKECGSAEDFFRSYFDE